METSIFWFFWMEFYVRFDIVRSFGFVRFQFEPNVGVLFDKIPIGPIIGFFIGPKNRVKNGGSRISKLVRFGFVFKSETDRVSFVFIRNNDSVSEKFSFECY